jgi:hypothetical protein
MNVRTFAVQEQTPVQVKYQKEVQTNNIVSDPVKELVEMNGGPPVETPYSNLQTSIQEQNEMAELKSENMLYKQLLSLMKSSYTIPNKLLDEQKKIIIPKGMLRRFIAHLLQVSADKVLISTNVETNCLCKSKIEDIDDIKIKYAEKYSRSFELFDNEMYNRISDEFNISLRRVIGF